LSSCCDRNEYGEVFTAKEAEDVARRFRRRGLTGTRAELAAAVQAIAPPGATILEAGGGVGDIQITLLEAGAERTTNVELSRSWEAAAEELLAEHGVRDRVTRVLGNFVEVDLKPADIVILHRVVCCYWDWNGLLQTAAARARRAVGLTFPVDRWWTKGFLALANIPNRVRGRTFRAYIHPPSEMIGALTRLGFEVAHDHAGPVWRTVVLQRWSETGGDGA
jgi:magnesium-protoporphyrin O-methyltransferase